MSMSKEELKEKARAHWKKHNPQMFKELQASGELEESLNQAAEDTLDGMKQIEQHMIEKNGYTKDQAERCAWEMMREEWILLPEASPEE